MNSQTEDGPSDEQLYEAMRTIEDAIGTARQSKLTPSELECLLAAIAPIPEIIRRNANGFVPYKLAIAIEDAQQVMRDLFNRQSPATPSKIGGFFRRPAPRIVIIDGPEPPRPTSLIGRLIYRFRYGRPATERELRQLRPTPTGKGVGMVIPPHGRTRDYRARR